VRAHGGIEVAPDPRIGEAVAIPEAINIAFIFNAWHSRRTSIASDDDAD